jgi:hypothetical protein
MAAGPDPGAAASDGAGRLHKSGSGHHRFYVERPVGVQTFPLLVSYVARGWAAVRGIPRTRSGLDELTGTLREVEQRYA